MSCLETVLSLLLSHLLRLLLWGRGGSHPRVLPTPQPWGTHKVGTPHLETCWTIARDLTGLLPTRKDAT